MRCPVCATPVTPVVHLCPQCGTDLPLFAALHALQQDLQDVQRDLGSLSGRFQAIQEHLATFLAPTDRQAHGSGAPGAPRPANAAAEALGKRLPTRPPANRGTVEVRFGQQWLLVVGIATTVLGIALFLKYAFDQAWISPTGQVVLAYLGALGFLGGGELCRRRVAATFGLYLLGGGMATLYVTTFAAYQLYGVLEPWFACALMVLITVLAGLLALWYDTAWLAILGLIGGFATPIMLGIDQDRQQLLMSYITLLNSGILMLAVFKRWHVLQALGFLCTWLLFTGWYVRFYHVGTFWSTGVFVQLSFLIYALIPFVHDLFRPSQERFAGLAITVCNAAVAFGFSFVLMRPHSTLPTISLVSIAYALLFLSMAQVFAWYRPERREPRVLLLSQGLLFLILTVPLLCSGPWVTMCWAIQAVALCWVAVRFHNLWVYYGAGALLLLTAGKLFPGYDYWEIFHFDLMGLAYREGFTTLLPERWGSALLVLGALLGSAQLLRRATDFARPWRRWDAGLLLSLFAVLLCIVLTLEVSAWGYEHAPTARFAAVSVLWALLSVGLMGLGFVQQHLVLRCAALGLFAITMLKVVFVDMAHVRTPFRILSFVVLGVMLIGASYLYYRYREELLLAPAEEEQP